MESGASPEILTKLSIMKKLLIHCTALASLAVLPLSEAQSEGPFEGKLDSFLGDPEMEIQPIFKGERFPNIVVTKKGTVLATWGTKQIRARRSEDGGKTWDA